MSVERMSYEDMLGALLNAGILRMSWSDRIPPGKSYTDVELIVKYETAWRTPTESDHNLGDSW